MDTKTCSITKAELEELIEWHGRNVADSFSDRIERLGYLHKRLKAFDEPEVAKAEAPKPLSAAPAAVAQGWGSPNGS